MKVAQLIALAALTVAGSAAMADDPTVVVDHFTPTRTRAEVQADVKQARQNGQHTFVTEIGGQVSPAQTAAPSDLTRAQVRGDTIRGRSSVGSGDLPAVLNGTRPVVLQPVRAAATIAHRFDRRPPGTFVVPGGRRY